MFNGKPLSWSVFESKTNQLARALRTLNVQAGDRVGVFLPHYMEWPLAYLAILKLGAVIVPLDVRYGDQD